MEQSWDAETESNEIAQVIAVPANYDQKHIPTTRTCIFFNIYIFLLIQKHTQIIFLYLPNR